MEGAGATLRFGHTEAMVVSVYVAPLRNWDRAELKTPRAEYRTVPWTNNHQ